MVLALSCSTPVGSLALANNSKIISEISWESERSHAEFVSEKINTILNTHGIGFKDITCLSVDIGPGSFTGIRIAVNTIKTLSYVLNLPIFTLNSLEILSLQVQDKGLPIYCSLDAFTNSVYFFRAGIDTFPTTVKSSELKGLFKQKTICLGDGFRKYLEELSDVKHFLEFKSSLSLYPRASDLALATLENVDKNRLTNWKLVEPLYVRRSSAEEKLLV